MSPKEVTKEVVKMAGIPPANLVGYPGAPPNLGGSARGGIRGGVGGVLPVASGLGVGPPLPQISIISLSGCAAERPEGFI